MKAAYLSTIQDHFLSQEAFELDWEPNGRWAQTQFPKTKKIAQYYKTEDYISHQQKSGSWYNRLYGSIQSFMFSYKWKHLEQHLPQKASVLDYGCGTGDFLSFVHSKGNQAYGLEPNEHASAIAQSKGIQLYNGIDQIPEDSLDCISLWHVLEHISDPAALLTQLQSKLKSDGILVVALPNFESWDAKHYKEYWAAWDVPRHLWHFSKDGFKDWSTAQGYSTKDCFPLWFDALYVSLLSEKYRQRPFPWLFAALKGIYSNFVAQESGNYSSHFFILKPTLVGATIEST